MLFLEGHNVRKGYAISRRWTDAECMALPPASPEDVAPVRYITERQKAFALVERWNRRFGSFEIHKAANGSDMSFPASQREQQP